MPERWQTDLLGKFCYIKARIGWRGLAASEYTDSGPFLIAGKHIDSGRIDWDAADHISEFRYNESSEIALQIGDVILSKDGTIGRVARIDWLPGRATINGTMMLIRPLREIDYRFLYHVLNGAKFKKLIEDKVSGSSIPHIFQRDMVTLPVSFPPLEQQKKLAEILDTLDTAIQETEAIVAKLKAVKQGLLHDLLTRGIDDNGELRPPQSEAPHLYKPSPLGWIPKEWGTPTFAELQSQPILGLAVRGAATDGRNVGLVKMGNLCENNELDLTSVEGLAISRVKNIDKFLLEDGDLLFNTRNTPELVGKTCSWHGTLEPYVFDNNILRARIPRRIGSGHYFAHYLGSEIGRRSLLRLATGTTSVAAIYWKDLGSLKVPAPPTAEQAAIHEMIKSVEVKRSFVERGLQILRQMKAGLMDDLLTGRVRVTPLLQEAQHA